ncbi:MAG: hypothetical protein IBX57_01125 [Gammaproteobacteria bacterium]|nr:hypothetical protein [Gammaproteobacteria bacterium]
MFNATPKTASYSCTALVGTNKAGELKPDADGYYTLVVGALNSFNSGGAFYAADPAKSLFEKSSGFMRRVESGNCKGETGHPKMSPGQSRRDFINRVLTIEETRVCCHFKSFKLEEGFKTKDGKIVTAIIAELKPAGPMGDALKESLENKHENVCFSIRSLTDDHFNPAGFLQKDIKTIVTFDWVTEPGISAAQKWESPSLESLDEADFITPELIDELSKENERNPSSMETSGISLESIRHDLGWDKVEVTTTKPKSLNW